MNKAILTIRDAATMHPSTRKRLAKWLRDQADSLEAEAKQYPDKYQAKFK